MSKKPKPKGFAAMTPEKRRQIAAKGGRAASASGKAHHFTHDEAVAAGQIGGKKAQESGNAYRFNSRTGRAAQRKRRKR